jgi:hypothetical protein
MDDFFLRPEQRTAKRLKMPGENVDYERFLEEVLLPYKAGAALSYRPFDCSTQQLQAPVHIVPGKLLIVEGAYSCHKSLYEHYDQILAAINDIGLIGNARAKEEAVELLGRYAPDLAKVKEQLASTEKYIKTLESRISYDDAVIRGKDSELNEKELALYEERAKVMQLEHKQKQLVGLLNKIPAEMRDQLMKSKRVKDHNER